MSDIDAIMKSMDCIGWIVADGNGKIMQVDDSFHKRYGLSADELIDKNVIDLERKGLFKPSSVAEVLRTGKEITIKQKILDSQEVIVTAFPISENGKITKVVTFSRDLSGYEKIKETYDNMSKQLTEMTYEQNLIEDFNTKNNKFHEILASIKRVAKYDINIMILGETGVGKSMMAKKIHNISDFSEGKFVEINCGAMPENLIESELFGYEKGAFTGANENGAKGLFRSAEGGTLFLDEISELPLQSQVKLLKVLHDQEIRPVGSSKTYKINCRLICASNKDLSSEVQENNFRRDLFYRLNAVTFTIPPIRDRREDIAVITNSILTKANKKYNLNKIFDPNVLSVFMTYSWPGNIRELENTINRMVITSENEIMGLNLLPEPIQDYLNMSAPGVMPISNIDNLDEAVENYEASIIREKYKTANSSVKLAKALNISQTKASRKIRKYLTGKE